MEKRRDRAVLGSFEIVGVAFGIQLADGAFHLWGIRCEVAVLAAEGQLASHRALGFDLFVFAVESQGSPRILDRVVVARLRPRVVSEVGRAVAARREERTWTSMFKKYHARYRREICASFVVR